MSSELKPCPFCKCGDVRTEKTVTDGSVWCAHCGAKFTVRHDSRSDDGLDTAIVRWNTRATAQHPAVEALKSAEEWNSLWASRCANLMLEEFISDEAIDEEFSKFIRAIQQNAITSQTPAETSEKPEIELSTAEENMSLLEFAEECCERIMSNRLKMGLIK